MASAQTHCFTGSSLRCPTISEQKMVNLWSQIVYETSAFIHLLISTQLLEHWSITFAFRPHEDWLRYLLLFIQLDDRQSDLHGELERDAGVQRWNPPKKCLLNIKPGTRKNSWCLCLSGNNINKALMSKVAQVSKSHTYEVTFFFFFGFSV